MKIPFQKYHHGNLRDDILKAAYDFVKENGYAAMSLRGIAEECNVSATAIYRHYETKEHLLADVVAEGFVEFNRLLKVRRKMIFSNVVKTTLLLLLIITIFMICFLVNLLLSFLSSLKFWKLQIKLLNHC